MILNANLNRQTTMVPIMTLKALSHFNKVVTDEITDIKNHLKEKVEEQTQELRKSYEKLKELDAAKESFISVASHALRTPLTVIKGYADFLRSEKFGQLNAQQKDFIERIFCNTNDLLALINDILDVSKIEAGHLEIEITEINLAKFCEKITADFQIMAAKKQIDFKVVLPGKTELTFKTDEKYLREILNNLLGNAYKFTPPQGKITLSIENFSQDPRFLQFCVSDSGIGIPQQEQKTIFEKFHQIGGFLRRQYNGTGLGLTIVNGLVSALRGRIWVESQEKQGSKFFFLILKNYNATKTHK